MHKEIACNNMLLVIACINSLLHAPLTAQSGIFMLSFLLGNLLQVAVFLVMSPLVSMLGLEVFQVMT